MTDIMGYNEPYPPEKERISAWFDSAFHEIYGYTVATYCPCSLAKMKILHEKGFVSGGEDLREARWEKDRLNCLSCDHLQFVAILEDLSKGSYDLLGKSEIVQKYHKTIIEEAEFCSGKHPLRVYKSYSYEKNDAAFPYYLEGMPTNLLVNLLSSRPFDKKIKRCPHCGRFFFAKDAKRTFCYETSCLRAAERAKKQHQRETDPVKYV